MKKKLLYKIEHERLTIECFKLLDVDELTDNAYEIVGTNPDTGSSTSVTTNCHKRLLHWLIILRIVYEKNN